MGIIANLIVLYSNRVHKKNNFWIKNPIIAQNKLLEGLVKKAKNTQFGIDHHFKNIKTYQDYKRLVPIVDYEDLKPYVEKTLEGQENILWPGKPLYFCKTSGTTSGEKYIPISKESMPFHLKCAKDAILSYIHESGKTEFLKRKNMFIQGSPVLDFSKKSPIGRLSGIVAHHLPWYLKSNNLPSYETNCMEDWEKKVDKIVAETIDEDMGIISGIPPWVQMYFEKINSIRNQSIAQVFPNFSLFIYGGVNFEPYKKRFLDLIGKHVPSIETYPASEGFIAYQNKQNDKGLLLCVDHGIFYEFIPAQNYFDQNPPRLSLEEIEMGVDYALILNTNAGLWGYSIGDTVRFVSRDPYKIVVSGRIKHFTSAFGEHVIAKEVEEAMKKCVATMEMGVNEFHVAPQISPVKGLPYHEWLIEFEELPQNIKKFSALLDQEMRIQNSYYNDLIEGNVLQPLVVNPIKKSGFRSYMKSVGKLGGQNKVPRLANDRKIAELLTQQAYDK
ncbi:MAG: GH3 auxin-responsive promoter family protein [Flavobacteriales bacterium]